MRIIVPQTAGGGTDTFARAIGQKLSESLGQPVVIENKAGAGGVVVAAAMVAKAAADGYTLLVTYEGSQAINQSLYENLPFNSLKDFEPVATIAVTPFLLIVGPRVKAKSLKEFIAYARANPGKIALWLGRQRLGQSSARRDAENRSRHQAGACPLQGRTRGDRRRHGRPYRCGLCQHALGDLERAERRRARTGGQQRQTCGRRADVPSIAESGSADFDVNPWWGILAPAGLDPTIAKRSAPMSPRC